MESKRSGMVHALEFDCGAPIKFYEHCAACPRFERDCPDLALGGDILRGKKKIAYNDSTSSDDSVHISDFNCLAPINYFEKTRKWCAHQGRCREEGLLLALLTGKKELSYAHKAAIELPRLKTRLEEAAKLEEKAREAAGS